MDVPDFLASAHPWPSAESSINRTLTDLGVGRDFTLEYAVAGEVRKKEMKVAEAPVHYEAAPLRKSEDLGLTVRDLTYEVRRYFQLDPGATGVLVSKVERGGRASVAGLRMFDVVFRVDDQPVADVAAFEKATQATGELRLAVKDKLKERIVKIAAGAK
jgi:S1-C subfamily serine protease